MYVYIYDCVSLQTQDFLYLYRLPSSIPALHSLPYLCAKHILHEFNVRKLAFKSIEAISRRLFTKWASVGQRSTRGYGS